MLWPTPAFIPWFVLAAVWLAGAPLSRRTLSRESTLSRLSYGMPMLLSFLLLFSHRLAHLVSGIDLRFWPSDRVAGLIGLAVTAVGAGFAIWARMHLGRLWSGTITLKEGHYLVRSGPYRLARHPIYTGFLVAVAGSAIAIGTLHAALAVPVVLGGFLLKMRREERLMSEQFGGEYEAYSARVKRLIPFVW